MAGKKIVPAWLTREQQLYADGWCLCGFQEHGREYQRRDETTGQLEKLRVRHDGTDEPHYTPIPEPVAPAEEQVPVKAPKQTRKGKKEVTPDEPGYAEIVAQAMAVDMRPEAA